LASNESSETSKSNEEENKGKEGLFKFDDFNKIIVEL